MDTTGSRARVVSHEHLAAPRPQADWGSGYWQQDMEQRCYTGSHLTAIWAIGIPGVVLLCIGASRTPGPSPRGHVID